jgi:hypothetical protein
LDCSLQILPGIPILLRIGLVNSKIDVGMIPELALAGNLAEKVWPDYRPFYTPAAALCLLAESLRRDGAASLYKIRLDNLLGAGLGEKI